MQLPRRPTAATAALLVLAAVLGGVGGPRDGLAQGTSLRFFGHGTGDIDRVKIPIDAPAVAADVGGDFTLELWVKANPGENGASGCAPGNDNWITGNTILDRDVFGPGDLGDYGLSLFAGGIAFGVATSSAGAGLCGATPIADGLWHHVAVTRASSGAMALWVDGALDGSASGPAGDVSYADGRSTPYANDPFLVLGAEKHDAGASYPSFSGWIDELRISDVVRYAAPFSVPSGPFTADADTVALYHFDDGAAGPCSGAVLDSSGAAGGPSDGFCSFGGSGTAGPRFSTDVPTFGGPPADRRLAGRSLVVRDHATNVAQRRVVVVARDGDVAAPAPGGANDPTIAGATLRLGRGVAEADTFALPAARWKALGSPPGAKGYRYADPRRLSGPCTAVTLSPGRQLAARCNGAGIAFTLDEPAQGALHVTFAPGGASAQRSCILFGGIVVKDVATSPGPAAQFRALNAPAPPEGTCPP